MHAYDENRMMSSVRLRGQLRYYYTKCGDDAASAICRKSVQTHAGYV